MSETDTAVPPALTREEWEVVMGRGVVAGRPNSRDYLGDHPTVSHFRMAVANTALPDDHPGKITRLNVQMLRALLVAFEPNDHVNDWLPALADKLAALLPPE